MPGRDGRPICPLDQPLMRQFAKSFSGDIILPGDETYDSARKVWNGMIDKHPGAILRCTGVADIQAAINFARDRGLPVAVRGGGHNVAGNAVCDDGIVIDLSRMKGIHVDPARRIVRAQPGLTWGEFDHETQAFGLAVTGGVQSTTGIAGFTLGGGYGWLARKRGLTCDNLLSADVATAEGRLLTVDSTQNPDLFWGIRGGGGNFGVVTSFQYRLHPLGDVLAGMVLHPITRAEDVLKFYRDYVTTAPDELFTIVILMTAPSAPHLPERLHGTPMIALTACYSGRIEDGERVLKPFREFGSPEIDLIRPQSYTTHQTMLDAVNPPGLHNYWKAEFLRSLDDEVIHAVVSHISRKKSPKSRVLISHMQGAVSRVEEGETAYTHRDAPFLLNINAMWTDPDESEVQVQWARDFWSGVQPFSAGGGYVNFLSNEGEDRVRAAYGPETYRRLVELKNRYDLTNFFRLNQNIRPSSAGQ
jgi:hypothetical protein